MEVIPIRKNAGLFWIVIRALDMLLFSYHTRGNILLQVTARYDYQSAYCKKLAKFSTD